MTIAVLNTKGGASKSTVALQVAAGYFLQNNEEVELFEFDDENKDSLSFKNSAIKATQIKVGDGKDITDILRNSIIDHNGENLVLDIGGNKTTTIFIDGLKKSMLFKKLDLIIIPMSGGAQDLTNAIKTYDMIKSFNIPVIFALSRVRRMDRIWYQFNNFFRHFPNDKFISLKESDVIDLSRELEKSVYEIALDSSEFKPLLEQDLMEAFDCNDKTKQKLISFKYEIYGEAAEYLDDILKPAWNVIDEVIKS